MAKSRLKFNMPKAASLFLASAAILALAGYSWHTYADTRAFMDNNGFAEAVMIPKVTACFEAAE